MTAIPQFQPGFRLMDGTAMNALVDAINNMSGAGTPGPLTGTTLALSDTLTQAKTSALTTLGNIYNAYTKLMLSATGIASGNGRGGRRELTLSGTVTGGAFIAGGQDKLIVSGTMNHADSRLMAGFSQLDGSAGTFTAGQLAAHWIDMGATAPGGGWNTGAQSYVCRMTNTTSSAVQAIHQMYGKATYAWQLDDNGGGWIAAGAVGGSQDKKLKCIVNGTTYYIPLNTA